MFTFILLMVPVHFIQGFSFAPAPLTPRQTSAGDCDCSNVPGYDASRIDRYICGNRYLREKLTSRGDLYAGYRRFGSGSPTPAEFFPIWWGATDWIWPPCDGFFHTGALDYSGHQPQNAGLFPTYNCRDRELEEVIHLHNVLIDT